MLTFFVNYPGNFRFIWFWTKLTLKPWWHMFFLIWKTSKLSNCSWNVIIILTAHHPPPPGHINSTGFLNFYILYKREEPYKKRKVKVLVSLFFLNSGLAIWSLQSHAHTVAHVTTHENVRWLSWLMRSTTYISIKHSTGFCRGFVKNSNSNIIFCDH